MVQCRLSSPASILVHSPPLPWIQDLYIAQPKVCEVANQSLVWSTNQKEWTKIKLTITEKNPHLNKTLAFSVWMKYGVEALDFWEDVLWAIISYLICWGSIMSSSVTCSVFTGLVPAWGLLEWLCYACYCNGDKNTRKLAQVARGCPGQQIMIYTQVSTTTIVIFRGWLPIATNYLHDGIHNSRLFYSRSNYVFSLSPSGMYFQLKWLHGIVALLRNRRFMEIITCKECFL